MKVLRVIVLAWIIVMGMCFSASASLVKTEQGSIGEVQGSGDTTPSVVPDTWKIINGSWYSDDTLLLYYDASVIYTNSSTGEVLYNSDLRALPDDFSFQFTTTFDAFPNSESDIGIKFRYVNPENYYFLRLNLKATSPANCASGTCIELIKYVNGSPTELAEVSWSPTIVTTEFYNIKLKVLGSSIVVYMKELPVGIMQKQYQNQKDLVQFTAGETIINVTDTAHASGKLAITVYNPQVVKIAFHHPRLYSSANVRINGTNSGQYAMLCQSPEQRQAEGTNATSFTNTTIDLTSPSVSAGQSFDISAETISLESVTVKLKSVNAGTLAGNLKARICSDSNWWNCTTVLATSDEVAVDTTWGGTKNSFDYPEDVTFTFTTAGYPTLTKGVAYYFQILGGTGYTADVSNYVRVWQIVGTSAIARQASSGASNDLMYLIRGRQVMRAVSGVSNGTDPIYVDMSNMWHMVQGKIKVSTSNADCYTSIVDETPSSMMNHSGDVWQYYSGRKLTAGPALGCPISGGFPIWVRGNNTGQTAKICYSATSSDVDQTKCEANCSGYGCSVTSAFNLNDGDYTGSVDMIGLSSNTAYSYAVLIDGTYQESSKYIFTSPPLDSEEVSYSWCGAACFSMGQAPYRHLLGAVESSCKMYWAMGDNMYNHSPVDMPFAFTTDDYYERQRDTYLETNYANLSHTTYMCRMLDNHEWGGAPSGITGKGHWYVGVAHNSYNSHLEQYYDASQKALAAYTDNTWDADSVLVAATRDYKASWGKTVFIIPDHIFNKDGIADTDTSVEATPTCSATNGATTITCSGDHTSGLNSARSLIIFENRAYPIVSGNYSAPDTTLTLSTGTVSCGTCTSQVSLLWKSGKQMYDRTQMLSVMNALKSFDENTNVKAIFYMSSKPLKTKKTGFDIDSWADVYTKQRDLLMKYCNNNISKKCTFYTGDRHISMIYKHTFIPGSGQWEFLMGNGSAPNIFGFQPNSTDIQMEFTHRKALGVVDVNTNLITDVTLPKAGLTYRLRDDVTVYTYDGYGNLIGTVPSQVVYSDNELHEVTARLDITDIIDSPNQSKIARDSNGYCYVMYHSGATIYVKSSSNTICTQWNSPVTLTTGGITTYQYGSAMYLYEGATKKLFFTYPSGVYIYTESATVSAVGVITLDNNDFEVDGETGIPSAEPNIVVTSDGYVVIVAKQHHNANNQDRLKLRMFSCGTLCITGLTASPWLDYGSAGVGYSGVSIASLTSNNVLITWLQGSTLYWSKATANWFGANKLSDPTFSSCSANAVSEWTRSDVNATSCDNVDYRTSPNRVSTFNDGYYYKSFSLAANIQYTFQIYGKQRQPTGSDTPHMYVGTSAGGNTICDVSNATSSYVLLSCNYTPTTDQTVYMSLYGANTGATYGTSWDDVNVYSGTTPTKQSMSVDVATEIDNSINAAWSGWQPSVFGDGAGGAGLVYLSPRVSGESYPRMTFKKFNGTTWENSIYVTDGTQKATSPSITRSGDSFIISFLSGTLTNIEVYKSDSLTPSTFINVSHPPQDGWIKTRLQVAPQVYGSNAVLLYERVYGLNKGGAGLVASYIQTTLNPGSLLPIMIPVVLSWREQ